MWSDWPEAALLGGLAASAFLSATLLPGNSELVLAGILHSHPQLLWWALLVATVANSAGSLTSFWLGSKAPARPLPPRAARWFARFGPAALWLSWVPFAGDALPLAAGWLRLRWLPCLCWILLGKASRYAALAWSLQLVR